MKIRNIILFTFVSLIGLGLFHQTINASNIKIDSQYDYYQHSEDRNFVATGKSALYKTSNMSKQVVSKTKMKQLGKSSNPANIFRLYRSVKLTDGKTLFKVVSMNGKYRGYVHANGIKQIQTLKNYELSHQVKGQLVTLNNVKIHPIFEFPTYTQYKINRLKYDNSHNQDMFVIDGAVKKSVGGQLYYHITSTKDKMINGYVYAGKGYIDNQVNSSFGGLSLVAR